MKKYDIFLFDADGTLFDYDRAEEQALKTMFARCGFVYTEKARNIYRDINVEVWASFERGEMTKDELQTIRFTLLFGYIGVSYDEDVFNKQYLLELGKGSFLISGAFEICEYIAARGKKIFIVTNGLLATQHARIKYSQIKNFITDYFVSEVVGSQKPDIRYFEYVFERIPPAAKENILIVGDSLTADIAGGKRAGIDTCWFNETGVKNQTSITPVYEINKLTELKNFV